MDSFHEMCLNMHFMKAGPRPAEGDKKAVSGTYCNKAAKDGFPTMDAANLYDMFHQSVKRNPDAPCLGWRPVVKGKAGPYKWLTYKQTHDQVEAVASGLAALGLGHKDRIGIYGCNSPEWMIAMQACNRQASWCVPLYDSLGENAVEYIIRHAEISIVFTSGEKFGALARALKPVTDLVRTVVVWGDVDPTVRKAVESAAPEGLGIKVYTLEDFQKLGRSKPAEPNQATPEDLCTIMYTSGTTGNPKGVMLTHSNLLHTVAGTLCSMNQLGGAMGEEFTPEDTMLSYLPLAHIFDRAMEELFMAKGARIGYWRGKIDGVLEDIQALKPTFFIGVPRVFDRVYNGVLEQVAKSNIIRQTVFKYAVQYKSYFMKQGFPHNKAAPLLDRIVFSKVKTRLGGKVRLVASGGAPLAQHVEEFLGVTMCAPVVQGYGLTETCGSSFSAFPILEMLGTVGVPLPLLDFRLEAIPEMNYDISSSPPRGEICLRGPTIFTGYYKDEEKTREVLDPDGWFHTGDVGEILPCGAVKIIDRKKSIFKLAQGEYIAPEKIEGVLSKSAVVQQALVTGTSMESSVVAIIVPFEADLRSLVHDHSTDYAKLCSSEATVKAVLAELTSQGRESGLKPFEIPKAIFIDPEPWTIENSFLTPTYKLKRSQLAQHYQEMIDAMYAHIKQTAPATRGL
eukprot:jgi/Botrbrau1/12305/Bobra.0205s0004.1